MNDIPKPLVDALGNRVLPGIDDARIVSLSPALTELLVALEKRDKLVGRTRLCTKSVDGITAVSNIGTARELNLERLVALAPTHILLTLGETPHSCIEALKSAGLPIVAVDIHNEQDNFALFAFMGALFNAETAADTLARRFEAALARLKMAMRKKACRSVLYVSEKGPCRTITPDSYAAALFALTHLTLIGTGTHSSISDGHPPIDWAEAKAADFILFNGARGRFKHSEIRALASEFGLDKRKTLRLENDPARQYGARAIDAMDQLIAMRDKVDGTA